MNRIVGIDLGTSTSEIAYIDDKGEVKLIPNHLGEFITPSVVHIKEDGEVVVGLPAKEQLLLKPESTFMEVKRLMGTSTELKCHGKSYTPVEMSSFILKYLVECASTFLNESINRVVITVPAYFTDAQRKDTIKAGELIGLKVERIINEPTAASLDYGIMNTSSCENILVYDFGGGTLDVTVLELFEGVIDVKSSCGNSQLGGKDFDEALVKHIVGKINSRYNMNIEKDLRSMVRIKQASEECKIALSTNGEYNIDLPFLFTRKDKPIGYSETITREIFEGLIKEKVYGTGTQIKTALVDSGISTKDLDLVLLVGGTTRVPLVGDFLKEEFGFSPKTLVDPDLAVVRGAAIQGGIINDEFKDSEKEIVITDVCPHSLSTSCLRTIESDDIFFGFKRELFCDILIERNTTIPSTMQKIYSTAQDFQKAVDIEVYQGESEVPEENTFLNKFRLSGIPSAKEGKEQIKIEFSYDLNGLLVVSAEIVSTGKSANIEIDTKKVISEEELENWKDGNKAKSYRTVIRKAESTLKDKNFDDDIYDLKDTLNELKKGIIYDWDSDILDDLKSEILDIIEDYEEE